MGVTLFEEAQAYVETLKPQGVCLESTGRRLIRISFPPSIHGVESIMKKLINEYGADKVDQNVVTGPSSQQWFVWDVWWENTSKERPSILANTLESSASPFQGITSHPAYKRVCSSSLFTTFLVITTVFSMGIQYWDPVYNTVALLFASRMDNLPSHSSSQSPST